jgi:hypothetical protein
MAKGPRPRAVNVTPPLLYLLEDPIWRAEFRGLFLGDGWLGITRFRGRKHGKQSSAWTYRPEVNITQTLTNRDLVYHVRDVLGGFVYIRERYAHGSDKAVRGPYFTWMARSTPVSRRAYRCLAEGYMVPLDKKADAIAAFGEYLDLLDQWGGRTKPDDIQEQIEALRLRVHPRS